MVMVDVNERKRKEVTFQEQDSSMKKSLRFAQGWVKKQSMQPFPHTFEYRHTYKCSVARTCTPTQGFKNKLRSLSCHGDYYPQALQLKVVLTRNAQHNTVIQPRRSRKEDRFVAAIPPTWGIAFVLWVHHSPQLHNGCLIPENQGKKTKHVHA